MAESNRQRKRREAREKREAQQSAKPTPSTAPVATVESLADQLAKVSLAEAGAEELASELGPPEPPDAAEPSGGSLEEVLRRAEGALSSAKSMLEKAKERETAAKAAESALAGQKRDQDEAFKKRKRALEAEHKARSGEVDRAESELLGRAEDLDLREAGFSEREAALRESEGGLAEQAARLTERELNAEQGFLAEKAQVYKPLETEVERLRAERDELDGELRERRANTETEARAEALKRAELWATEDRERTESQAKARREFDEEMAALRGEELSKVRQALNEERVKAAEGQEAARAQGQKDLDDRAAELDDLDQSLAEKARALRRREQDLLADQDLLTEDREAQARKVQRLVEERSEDLRHEATSLKKQLDDARTQRDAYFADLESRRELDRRFGDRTPEQLLADLKQLEKERDEAVLQLRQRPDAGAADRLADLEQERSAWLEKRSALEADLAQARGELATRRLAAIELEALKKQKEALEVHKKLLDGAVDELRARVDELTRQDDFRNPMTALTSLDESEELQSEVRTTPAPGRAFPKLTEFAEDLRHRIAQGVEGRTLYYTERDVRSFLGGLAMTRLMLLQGISGTGKTSLPLAFASAVAGGIEVVEVQAGWRDRQDLVGYYNAFHRHYYATNFLQALYRAGTPAYQDRVFMMVLDEINLSRPEQFFADFLSALEQPTHARRLTLVNDPVAKAPRLMVDGRHLPIPPNVWFVGTANHDESTAEFADKTYDRAHVMEMPRKTDAAHFDVEQKRGRNPLSFTQLEKAFEGAAERQDKAITKATNWLRKAPFADTLGRRFRVGWGNRLEHQLARYLPVVVESGGSVGEAMDHLLVTKVLRKLKDRHDVRATALEELHDQLMTAWDKLDKSSMPERCDALIQAEIEAKKGEELV